MASNLSLNQIIAPKQESFQINFHPQGKGKVLPFGIVAAVALAALAVGVVALLAYKGILPTSHLGHLGAMSEKAIYSLIGSGGAIVFIGTAIAAYYKRHGVQYRKRVEETVRERPDIQIKLIGCLKKAESSKEWESHKIDLESEQDAYFYFTKQNDQIHLDIYESKDEFGIATLKFNNRPKFSYTPPLQ